MARITKRSSSSTKSCQKGIYLLFSIVDNVKETLRTYGSTGCSFWKLSFVESWLRRVESYPTTPRQSDGNNADSVGTFTICT